MSEEAVLDSVIEDQDQGIESEVVADQSETDQVEVDVDRIENEEKQETVAKNEKFTGKTISDSIRNLSQQNPEQAKLLKQLQDAYFRNQTFEKSFPSAAEAASVKQLIEDVGGVEGIASLQEKMTAYSNQDEALSSGNPEVLDSFFQDFPEGAAKLAPAYLDKLFNSNPEAFVDTLNPYIAGFLVRSEVYRTNDRSYNLPSFLEAMSRESDPKLLAAGYKEISKWVTDAHNKGVASYAKNKPSGSVPQDAKLTERETALKEREQKIFDSSMGEKVKESILPAINSEVAKYAKQYGLGKEQAEDFKLRLDSEITALMNNDKTFRQQYNIRLNSKTRTPESLGKFVGAEYAKFLRDNSLTIAKKVHGAPRNSTQVTQVVKPTGPKTTTSGGPLRVANKPDRTQVDWDKPDAQLNWIKQQAYLKNGKFVSWKA